MTDGRSSSEGDGPPKRKSGFQTGAAEEEVGEDASE